MSTERGCLTPLTLVASPPGWDDYLDLCETITEMAHCLMEEDGQQAKMLPKVGTTPKQKDITQVKALPPSDDITMLPDLAFPSFGLAGSSRDNPVHLSDATDASASGSHPMKDTEMEDEATVLSHFSNTLSEMAASIVGLENGYFKALHEVIIETEKALCDVLCINAHYVSHMVTVMTSWQEAVQATTSHMEGVDTKNYLARREDAQRVTHEYVKEVIRACEEHDAAHQEEPKKRIEAIKADNFGDPVVRLLYVTCKAAHAQAERSQNTILLASTQAVYKALHSTVQGEQLQLAARSGSSRKSQSVRLEHDTLGSVVTSCTYASAMNSKISSVFIVYRRKTLTGSLDPTHVNGMDKPCIIGGESSL